MKPARSQTKGGDFVQIINPQGYVNNMEITALPDAYLVKGSQNMLIKNAQKAMTRKGYVLKGAAKTASKGIHSWFDWSTSSSTTLNLRSWYTNLEVWYKGSWITIASNLSGLKIRFATWWSAAELEDFLLLVNGEENVKMWSGGIAEVAKVTANTITKTGYLSGTDISFSNNGAAPDSIIKTSGGFLTAGFAAGDTLVIQGSTSNDGTYTIKTVSDTSIVISADESLTTEAAGASVVVKWPVGTFAEARFLTVNGGDASDRRILINGISYSYTGGESTGTLTGVSPDPTVQTSVPVNGNVIVQAIRTTTPSGMSGFTADRIGMQNNYVFYASSQSRNVLIAKALDYSDFTYTTPVRKPGEGFTLTLDSVPNAFAPAADQQTINKTGLMTIFCGDDDQYSVTFTLSSDQVYETINIIRQKTGSGLSALSQECIATIRNAILFITKEPTLEMLGHVPQGVDTPRSVPLSDPIRDDFENYDFTNASTHYHLRNLYIAIPKHAVWLIRDFQNNYWQPPQTGAFSGFSTIDGVLCAHSAFGNETYELNVGYNDNGAPIAFQAAYGYDNYGSRFSLKGFDEHGTELYVSKNTKVTKTINYEYKGSADSRTFIIDGSKEAINFMPKDSASIGSNKLGQKPIGSSSDPLSETTDGYIGMGKCRVIQSTTRLDFFERQVIFSSSDLDARFHIIAFGENVEMSDNIPSFIKDP